MYFLVKSQSCILWVIELNNKGKSLLPLGLARNSSDHAWVVIIIVNPVIANLTPISPDCYKCTVGI